MEDLLRASNLVFDIDRALIASRLLGSERLKRCLSAIDPLLAKLRTMRCPWGDITVRSLAELQEALERVDSAVRKHSQDASHNWENDCECVAALRQLWQRQIEMNLAVQFQLVLDDNVDQTAWSTLVEPKAQLVGSTPGLVTEKAGIEPALAHH